MCPFPIFFTPCSSLFTPYLLNAPRDDTGIEALISVAYRGRTIQGKEGETMFARITTFQFKIFRIDDAVKILKESIVPAAKSQKGFKNLYFFLDRKTGKAISVALWESEEDAKANEQSRYYQDQLIKLMSLYAEPPMREGYEVVVQE